jgi:glyoxylase-like metal-dependent hydrolase (beta-lactamase superfamily II)
MITGQNGIYTITPTLRLLDISPPIAGYERFMGAYLFTADKKALVDVGPRVTIPNLIAALAALSTSPEEIDYIILTHIHIDHAGGTGTALKEMKNARVVAHSRARPHLIAPQALWESSLKTLGDLAVRYGEIEPVPEDKIIVATDLMELDLGRNLKLTVLLTPGHAPHHLSLFDRDSGVLIAGEVAGVYVHGTARPATPPPFRIEEALSSLDHLMTLQPEKICYGHFGCCDHAMDRLALAREKLLSWHEIVNSPALSGKNPEDILTALKAKDRDLDYLKSLDKAEYEREHVFLINSIKGLSSGSSLT